MRDWLIVNWLSLLAFLIALAALILAYDADMHRSGPSAPAAVAAAGQPPVEGMPKISFITGEDRDLGQAGIEMKNAGPGVVTIKSVDYFIDGRRMRDEEAVIAVAPRGGRNALQYTHLNSGARIGTNADTWLLFLQKRDTRPREYETLTNFLSDSVAVGVNYCSEKNACADACSKAGACGSPK